MIEDAMECSVEQPYKIVNVDMNGWKYHVFNIFVSCSGRSFFDKDVCSDNG
jgi:hypothetical protein